MERSVARSVQVLSNICRIEVSQAAIGTGISGLGAAYALSKGHEVELFERDERGDVDSNTVEHMVAGRTLALDTGFIVHNEDTYPNLIRLFRELGVRTQPSEMKLLGRLRLRHGLEYSGARTLRRRTAMVLQAPLLFDVSVLTNAASGLRFRGTEPARGRAARHGLAGALRRRSSGPAERPPPLRR